MQNSNKFWQYIATGVILALLIFIWVDASQKSNQNPSTDVPSASFPKNTGNNNSSNNQNQNTSNEQVFCTMEAKLCSDGSYVGRVGPRCEFEACPGSSSSVSGDLSLGIGSKGSLSGLNITLNKITDDSRCPKDVNCVWAGKVDVEVKLSILNKTEVKTVSSNGSGLVFENYRISIASVSPSKESQKNILPNEYRITFHIESLK